MSITIQEQEFLEWKQHEVTKYFLEALKKAREVWKEDLIRSNYANEEFVKGKAQAFLDVVEMKYKEVMEIMNDKY